MAHFEKHFTLEEATALLPRVEELLRELQGVRDELALHWEAAVPVLRAARTNGGGKEAGPYLDDLRALNARIRQLAELGVQLKDLDQGLVDFPAWRDGEEVLLCWHLGEERIAFWHDLESGFQGRQPL
jgi:hypothetical protein